MGKLFDKSATLQDNNAAGRKTFPLMQGLGSGLTDGVEPADHPHRGFERYFCLQPREKICRSLRRTFPVELCGPPEGFADAGGPPQEFPLFRNDFLVAGAMVKKIVAC